MVTLDLEMKVGDVFKGWEGHPDHIWRFQMVMAAILDFFPKGLTCDFGSKFQIFSKCVYGQIGPGNDV